MVSSRSLAAVCAGCLVVSGISGIKYYNGREELIKRFPGFYEVSKSEGIGGALRYSQWHPREAKEFSDFSWTFIIPYSIVLGLGAFGAIGTGIGAGFSFFSEKKKSGEK